jgi:hypothetical protein
VATKRIALNLKKTRDYADAMTDLNVECFDEDVNTEVVSTRYRNALREWALSRGAWDPTYVTSPISTDTPKVYKYVSQVYVAGHAPDAIWCEYGFWSKRQGAVVGHTGGEAKSIDESRERAAQTALVHVQGVDHMLALEPSARPFAEHFIYSRDDFEGVPVKCFRKESRFYANTKV